MIGLKKYITQSEQARLWYKEMLNNYQKALGYIESNNLETVSIYKVHDSIYIEGTTSEQHMDNIKSILIDGKEKT